MKRKNTEDCPSGRSFTGMVCLFLCLWSGFLQAQVIQPDQSVEITGTVTSAEDSAPLIGVTVVESGVRNGVTTDVEGRYKIKVASGAELVFSYTGYTSQTVAIAGKTVLDIVLTTSSNLLNDVQITGYTREIKSNVASAISSVKAKDIEKLVVVGIDQALQGQVAGLQVTQVSGAPGEDIAVRIRGVSTLGNNNPLFVIDGVPTTGNINMFSTADIESVEVLKDGAAAAIYGARAANGVILITTKKGKSGKARFTFDAYTGFQEQNRLPELLNSRDYLTIRNEAIQNANELRLLPNQLDTFDLAILDTLPDNNWLNEVFHTAPIHRYNLSATGGSEGSNYYIMGEYLNQDGTFGTQGFKKYLLRFNGEVGNKRFKIGNNFSLAITDRNVLNSTGDGFGAGNELNVVRYALIAAPLVPIRYADGSYVNVTSELGEPFLFGDGNANPLALIDATNWNIMRHRIFGNVFAELNILEGLKLRTTLGGDLSFENEKRFKQRLSAAIYDPTSLTEGRVYEQNLIWNNTLNFQRIFNRHRVSALAGMEAIQNKANYLGVSVNNFFRTDPLFRYVDNSIAVDIKNIGASGIETEWALLSYFAQAGYTFDNRYVINAAVRRDGSSRFGQNNRFGYFPSVSGAWNISNERFFEPVKFVSALKLRASWGRLGNQEIGNYPYASLIQTGNRVYSFGDQIVTGAQVVETGNSSIKWESTTQKDLGLDMSFWGDRLSVIADYYNKTTDGILVRIPVPQSGGSQNPPFTNAGKVENTGLELSVIYKNSHRNFHYSIGGNIATVKNTVLSLAGGEPILGGFGLSDGPLTKTEPGYPVGSFYLWKMEGIFQNQAEIDASPFQTKDTRPGDVKFADINGDNKIDDKDRSHLGSPFPDYIYGINLNLTWKNFDLAVLGQGIQGNDVFFLFGNFAYETQARGFNSYKDILDHWTPTNTDSEIPIVSIDDRNGNRRASTRFLEDGSYFRLRNVTLSCDLKKYMPKASIGSLRVYVTAQNALTLTKYPGLDPEIQANANDTRGLNISSDLAVGIDWGTVPAPRTFILGVNMGF